MYTADVYSSQRWDQTNSPPQIVPLNSNNKKGPDTNKAVINYRTGMLSLFDDFLYAPLQSVCDESMCATLMRMQRIKPYTEISLPVHAPKHLNNT